MALTFTPAELEFLNGQRLARLATVDDDGAPQNNPVGFFLDGDGAVLIGGRSLGASRKFRNVQANPRAALVIDELASTVPWVVRGVEIRGLAEALVDVDPPMPSMSREVIRVVPEWIASWGVEPDAEGMQVRRADAA